MNNKLRKLDLSKLCVMDIETARRNEVLELDSKEFELYQWKLRNKETGEFPPNEEVQKHYELNAALYPEFNRIVCISVAFFKDGTLYYKAITGEQKDIIEEYYNIISTNGFITVGWNNILFDGSQTRLKAFECGVDLTKIPEKINDSGKKEWHISDDVIDLMLYFKGTYYNSISLDAACMMAGIPSSKEDIKGSDVSRVYYEGGIDKIAEYCNKDVIATARLLCAMRGEHDYIKNFVDRTGAQTKQEKPPLIEAIYNQGAITKEHEEQLLEAAKGLTKKEKEGLITLVKAVLVRTEKAGYSKEEEELFEAIMKVKKTKK